MRLFSSGGVGKRMATALRKNIVRMIRMSMSP
jgi:hypothetical protein